MEQRQFVVGEYLCDMHNGHDARERLESLGLQRVSVEDGGLFGLPGLDNDNVRIATLNWLDSIRQMSHADKYLNKMLMVLDPSLDHITEVADIAAVYMYDGHYLGFVKLRRIGG